MIHFFTAVLFSVSANLDNLVIGITFGIQRIKIPGWSNFLIAAMTAASTFIAMHFGAMIKFFLPERVPNYIGAGTLMVLSLYYVIKSISVLLSCFRPCSEIASGNPDNLQQLVELSDSNANRTLDGKEAAVLAVGLILNNVGAGIAASVTGVNIVLTAILTFLFSLLFLFAGICLGNHVLGKIFGKYTSLTSGILLIGLAIVEWIN